MMDESQSGRGLTQSNQYFNTEGIVKLRLDTKPLLEDIELFLRGQIIEITRDSNNKPIQRRIEVGEPKANDKGIQAIMTKITAIINPSTVQGNFSREDFDRYIFNIRLELNQLLFVNRVEYDVIVKDHNMIIDNIVNLVEPFISRLIDNKERDSYSSTIRTVESATLEKNNKGWLPW